MERLSYPGGRWKRPALWTTFLVAMVVEQSWAIADLAWPGRLISISGLLVILTTRRSPGGGIGNPLFSRWVEWSSRRGERRSCGRRDAALYAPAVTSTPSPAQAVAEALAAGGDWVRCGGDRSVLRRRYRERFGAWGVFWTKAVVVLADADTVDLPAFVIESWRTGLRSTRRVMPPRGLQAGTLVLAVAVGEATEDRRDWALESPRTKFSTMCATAVVAAQSGHVTTNAEVTKGGRLFHERRLEVARELSEAVASRQELGRQG